MLFITNPKEYLKRKILLRYIKNKYNIKIYNCEEGRGYYQARLTFRKEAIGVNINDVYFYETVLHELSHLFDFRNRKSTLGARYEDKRISDDRLPIHVYGVYRFRGGWSDVLKEELVASKNAIRLGKQLNVPVNKQVLLTWFRSYSKGILDGDRYYNKTQIADIDTFATKYLK